MGRLNSLTLALCCTYAAMLGGAWAFPAGQSAERDGVVVATVGGEKILAGHAQRLLASITKGQQVSPAALPVFQAQVLSEIVDRELVLAYARRTKSMPGESEIEAALAKFAAGIAAKGRSLDEHLRQESITKADLRRRITWDLLWEKYLARYVTEERLASYFQDHRREFDGTQLSVSHILLRPERADDPRAMWELLKRARTIRGEITSGKISFAEAARRYSAGPSGKDGGKLGFIGRRGPMVESFSRAAFAMDVGQVSEPVVTRFGVHLIRCDEIKPGTKQLADVRADVEEALARELLDKLARFEEKHTPVEFTGKWPHFKPGTRELVVP